MAQGGICNGPRDYSWLSLEPCCVSRRIRIFDLFARHRQQGMQIVAVQRPERSRLPRCPARLSAGSTNGLVGLLLSPDKSRNRTSDHWGLKPGLWGVGDYGWSG